MIAIAWLFYLINRCIHVIVGHDSVMWLSLFVVLLSFLCKKIHANQVEAENKRLVAENKRLRLQARESKVKASGLEDTVAMG